MPACRSLDLTRIPRHTTGIAPGPRHNLDLYRLQNFCGRSRELHRLQFLLLDTQSHPVLALIGPAGMGKSTLATGAAWSVLAYFRDGVVYAAPIGLERFRFFDLVRQLDRVLGTDITGRPPNLWRTSILELLYQRHRLLILDDTETAAEGDWQQLQVTLQGLRAEDTAARVLIISDKTTDRLQELTQGQIVHLPGFTAQETQDFLHAQGAPEGYGPWAYRTTRGMPLALRLLHGLMSQDPPGLASGPLPDLEQAALRACQADWPAAYRLLELLVAATGEASHGALRDLFWPGEAAPGQPSPTRDNPAWEALPGQLQEWLRALHHRGLLELDSLRGRVAVHPRVRHLVATGSTVQRQGWLAAHARYYISIASQYERIDIENWKELDAEWGNVRQGADWCVQLIRQRIGQELLPQVAALTESAIDMAEGPAGLPTDIPVSDLTLVRNYGFAMALHAFYRHPPRSLSWIAAGAIACAGLADYRGFGRLLLHLGRQLYFRRQYADSLFWLQHAQRVFARRDMVLLQAYAHTDMGMVYRALGQPHVALRHCTVAYDCLAQGGNLEEMAGACLNLGSLALSLRDYSQALYQYHNALRLAVRLENRRLVANAFNNLGLVLEAQGNYSAAQAVYLRALELYQYLHLAEGESTVLNNLGAVAYLQEQYSDAEDWYRQALQRCARRGAWLDLAATQHNLGTVLLHLDRTDEADAAFAASRNCYRALQLQAYAAEEESLQRQPPA